MQYTYYGTFCYSANKPRLPSPRCFHWSVCSKPGDGKDNETEINENEMHWWCHVFFYIIHYYVCSVYIINIVEQELLTLPEHLLSSPVYSGGCDTLSLVLIVCFVGRCLSFCTFSFGNCVVCFSSIYGLFWFPLWYLSYWNFISGVRIARSLVFCVVFCRSLSVLLVIVLSVILRFTSSGYPVGIFKCL